MKRLKSAISPRRAEDYSEWYQQVIKAADLAESAPVRGCMVIKPYGYALWENIVAFLDQSFKARGVQNAYFPLFIPLSFIEREAEHVEGFAKETAVVTHTRLERKGDKLVPASKLDEPLIIRPTSETIIGECFKKWIQSHRDLPLKINQWANVVRWEMRPRLFLRTSEFLWQEGHTAHSNKEEAEREAKEMLELYANFMEEELAIPVFRGEKSENERFPGAETTYTFEAMMQDGKALQGGTSHHMGTNFAKAIGIEFTNDTGVKTFVETTSWGVTTRLIGALIMVHSDDDGLVLPPKIAPYQIVFNPFSLDDEVLDYIEDLEAKLKTESYAEKPLRVFIDKREYSGSNKKWHWVKKGAPIRIDIGKRDIESGKFSVAIRSDHTQKHIFTPEEFVQNVASLLEEEQKILFQRALAYRDEKLKYVETLEEFKKALSRDENLFIIAPFAPDKDLEEKIKEDYKVTIRCYPDHMKESAKPCIFTGSNDAQMAIFASAY